MDCNRHSRALHKRDRSGRLLPQTNYNSPNNSGYSSTSGWQYYDETTIRGLQSILEHGYPNDDGGFSADEARYATANAIRFWLAERGAEGVPDWMNLQLYSQFFRGAPGYEYLFQWCMYLLENARYQVTYSHSVSFSPITLTEDGDYYVGTTTVTLVRLHRRLYARPQRAAVRRRGIRLDRQ